LVASYINVVLRTLAASAVNEVVPICAYTSLLCWRVDRVISANDEDAGVVDCSITLSTSAGIVGRVIGIVVSATLAKSLNEGESGQTFADSVGVNVHVQSAGVNGLTSKHDFVIVVAFRAGAAKAVDGVCSGRAVTIERVRIEYSVLFAEVAFGFITVFYFDCWFAVRATG